MQGALQLRRDFEAVRELVCSERSGLAPEAQQALRALCVFRHTDTAVRCLLQQPGGLGGPPRGWGSLRRCCESGVGWEWVGNGVGWDGNWMGIGWDEVEWDWDEIGWRWDGTGWDRDWEIGTRMDGDRERDKDRDGIGMGTGMGTGTPARSRI